MCVCVLRNYQCSCTVDNIACSRVGFFSRARSLCLIDFRPVAGIGGANRTKCNGTERKNYALAIEMHCDLINSGN